MSGSNKGYLVVTAVGPDRAGIVSELSGLIHGLGGSLEDSRMALLGGEFALLLLVSGNEDVLTRVEGRLSESEGTLGLRLLSKRTSERSVKGTSPYRIHVSGIDRPGIVQAVTSVLARRGVNLAALDSRLVYAPESGTPMFVLEAELEVPSELALGVLQGELERKCDEESLEVRLEPRLS